MRTALVDFLSLDDLWERPAPRSRIIRVPVVGWLSVVDLLVAATGVLVIGLTVWLQQVQVRVDTGSVWRQVVSVLVLGLILCLRRRFPLTQGGASAAHLLIGSFLTPLVSASFFTQVLYFVSLHAAVAWGASRRAAWGLIAAVELALLGWVAVIFARTNSLAQIMKDLAPQARGVNGLVRLVVLYALINTAFVVGAAALGQVSWREARALHRAREQAATIAAQRSRLADQAVVAERLRISREIHDSVSHHVSVIGIQAAGARRAMEVAPDQARQALSAIEEESRLAVTEMHSLLGSLRQGTGVDPGLSDLAELCSGPHRHRLDLDIVGDTEAVGPALGLTVYRVVQEAITNVEKHARAAHAHVAVRIGPDQVEVEVTDDGRGARTSPPGGTRPGSTRPGGTRPGGTRPVGTKGDSTGREDSGLDGGAGVGLIGMAERVAAHRGTLETGPRVTGGWRVLARLPLVPGESS